MRRKVIVIGAAGRDFHNFNTRYRDDESTEVVAFTAAQIPGIEGRRYPAELAGPLWAVADQLPMAGRALFAAHRDWPRPDDDDLLSAWLAVNCIREWRGDTHWAIQTADELSSTASGVTAPIFFVYLRQ